MFSTYVSEQKNITHTLANNPALVDMQYSHSFVNHSLNFVDPTDGTHTNTIEGLWEIHIKRHIKSMRGMKKEELDGYLDEFMWRSWYFPAKASPANIMCGLVQMITRQKDNIN